MKKLLDSIENGKRLSALLQLGDIDFRQYYIYRTEHDEFLEQQPQLNQFVRAVLKDGKWVVLEEPIEETYRPFKEDRKRYINDLKEFESASKNVLFDGWHLTENDQENQFFVIEKLNENIWITFSKCEISIETISMGEEDVTAYSDLTKYNLPLTDNGEIYFNIKN